jgi:hypothetical protein
MCVSISASEATAVSALAMNGATLGLLLQFADLVQGFLKIGIVPNHGAVFGHQRSQLQVQTVRIRAVARPGQKGLVIGTMLLGSLLEKHGRLIDSAAAGGKVAEIRHGARRDGESAENAGHQ